jgi:acetyltransferase-like isoleucine patch superfamily enzyme
MNLRLIKSIPFVDWLIWVKHHFKYIINSQVEISYPAKIVNSIINKHVVIHKHCTVSNSSIDKYSYISTYTQLSNVSLGAFCSIGPNCLIGLGSHPSSKFVSTSPIFYSTAKQCGVTFSSDNHFVESKPIFIGNDVWIGANVTILDGVTIGDGAIVGAGSVVTKNILPYSVAVGNPAKVIKFRFTIEQINFLTNLKWWSLSDDWIIRNYIKFHDIDCFK